MVDIIPYNPDQSGRGMKTIREVSTAIRPIRLEYDGLRCDNMLYNMFLSRLNELTILGINNLTIEDAHMILFSSKYLTSNVHTYCLACYFM